MYFLMSRKEKGTKMEELELNAKMMLEVGKGVLKGRRQIEGNNNGISGNWENCCKLVGGVH